MDHELREEMIQILILVTGWNRTAFEKMLDSKIEEIYVERVMDRE